VRLDIDEREIRSHRLKGVQSVIGGAHQFLLELDGLPWGVPRQVWLAYLSRLKKDYGQDAEVARSIGNSLPYRVMDILNQYSTSEQIYTVDIGQNQMFAAQKLLIRKGQAWKTSGGLAPMGFALPAAIGAAFANDGKRQIYAITGDGGLHISSQSLLLIAQHRLPIKVILLNNRSLGMITQFQDLYFDQRKEGTTKESGYLVPDFNFLAKSCGLNYYNISGSAYSDSKALENALNSEGPAIVEFNIGDDTVVYPKLEVNMPIEDLNPKLPRDELKGLMLFDDEC
jgi:acetolactate synthase-1/2/3 large subunit